MKRTAFILGLLAFIIPLTVTGQGSESRSKKKIAVSGTIYSSDNKPVVGAQIFVDSINTGELTDGLGKYKVKVDQAAAIVTAASTEKGFGQAEIKGNNTVDIVLNGDTKNLAIFLAKNTKAALTKAEKAKKMNTYNNIYEMIRNEVPGVLVNGRSIVVQQQNSFFGSSQPLFVVNGVRVSSIDYINPQEVKSIQLLKGSYANIYGNEGANGVISITLRSGNEK